MDFVEQRLAPSDSFRIAAGLLGIAALPLIIAVGGMPIVLLVVAVGFAFRVYQNPKDLIVAGPLFVLAANVFLPSAARLDATNTDPAWEMRYWAAGLLLITIAPLPKLGWKVWAQAPRSLQCFLSVALAASLYGAARGNDLSYVLRQLFGSVLLGAYFILAQRFGGENEFCRTVRNYAVPCIGVFILYYAWVFREYGIHKEITSLPTQCGMLAILFAARGGWKWRAASCVMMLPALLLVERRALAGFLLGLILIWAMKSASKVKKIALGAAASALVVFSLAPSLGAKVQDLAMGTSIESLLPNGARDASSLEDRTIQLVEAGLIVRKSPVFGNGMGSELNWLSAARGDMQQAYVDNGWAYVAIKMGLLGVVSFLWFIWVILKKMPGNSVALSACTLSMLLLVMFTEPVFFQFTTAPLLGTVLGLLYGKGNVLAAHP